MPRILSIDTSTQVCSAALLINDEVQERYEVKPQQHTRLILPMIDGLLAEANISLQQLDAIAFTQAPGLIGSLLVGAQFAKSLALSLDKPLIAVHHMQAHVLANLIDDPKPSFPFLCLTVSGGHTMIVLVKDYFDMEIIGKTIDDAAGEAFDKIGKIMGLDYPAGPIIDKLAKLGNPDAFTFGKPKLENYDYSFSGIKTSVLYFLQKQLKENPNFIQENVENLCASVQKTIIDVLMKKLEKAAKDYDVKEVAIAGGVSANSGLREAMQKNVEKLDWNVYIPKFEYTTDNAAMIAMVAKLKFERGEFTDLRTSATAKYDL